MRAGKASDVIDPFDELWPGDKCVVVLRVSGQEQGRRDNLKGQRVHLPRAVEQAGGVVVAVREFKGPGHGTEWEYTLADLAELAREHDAVLVFATPCRVIRSMAYHSADPVYRHQQARPGDLEGVRAALGGVRVVTFLHPDASNEECLALLRKWGSDAKGVKGGRPLKGRDEFRDKWLPRAKELKGRHLSLRKIAARISRESGRVVTYGGVRKWLMRPC